MEFMKKATLIALTLLTLVTPLFAQLTPYYQSIQEIKAILDDARLEKLLGPGQMIQEIVKNENGYTIKATNSELKIKVHYQYFEKIGAAEFTIEFEPAKEEK